MGKKGNMGLFRILIKDRNVREEEKERRGDLQAGFWLLRKMRVQNRFLKGECPAPPPLSLSLLLTHMWCFYFKNAHINYTTVAYKNVVLKVGKKEKRKKKNKK